MRFGFAKSDITPRLGVELSGFGPFLHRYARAVRDRLWARAMAVADGERILILISCDLVGLSTKRIERVRQIIQSQTGIPAQDIMVHCTHTHSGPNATELTGWGEPDLPYLEVLPGRIAEAAVAAKDRLTEGVLSYATAPCEGIGLNREYDRDAPPLDEVLRDDWRPAKPELTDTVCHVLKVEDAAKRLLGFAAYFGCHPVVCCQETHAIHGDYAGVAMGGLEREFPGSVGLFLQGAQGDVNSCVVHKPEPESLLALDVIAARFANSVRQGLAAAQPLAQGGLRSAQKQIRFSRTRKSADELRKMLAEQEGVLHAAGASDSAFEVRMAAVHAVAFRKLLQRMRNGEDLCPPSELQGFRIGPVALLGAPFEIFQTIKNDVVGAARSRVPLVLGLTNGCHGYAPDRTAAGRGGYAADTVPIILGQMPFANIHDELVEALLDMDAELAG